MMRTWLAILVLATLFISGRATAEVILSPSEIEKALRHGPWPPEFSPDPSNRVSGNPEAIEFGARLFDETLLSRTDEMSCASCHQPEQSFTDAREKGLGRIELDRNTLALWNLQGQRWFGWSGDTDNLWAQSLTPIINPDEMAHTPVSFMNAFIKSAYMDDYTKIFGEGSAETPDQVLANTGKALAAYLETLTTGKTSFDRFRDALEQNDFETAGNYPQAAQRGLKLFLGSGNCFVCHSGPNFSNGEFQDAGVPYFVEPGVVDPGRAKGLEALANSPFTLDGAFTDDPTKTGAWAVQNVKFLHSNFGIFRVPTLRRTAQTAPYMHDGSIKTLEAVIDHYNEIDTERLHTDGVAILQPLGLSEQDKQDLLAFLNSLSDD